MSKPLHFHDDDLTSTIRQYANTLPNLTHPPYHVHVCAHHHTIIKS